MHEIDIKRKVLQELMDHMDNHTRKSMSRYDTAEEKTEPMAEKEAEMKNPMLEKEEEDPQNVDFMSMLAKRSQHGY